MNNLLRLAAASLLLLPIAAVRAADEPATDLNTTIKHDAKVISDAAKDGAHKTAAASKEIAHEVAAAATKGAHEVATASKQAAQSVATTATHGAEKAKAAVKGEKSPPAPPASAAPGHST